VSVHVLSADNIAKRDDAQVNFLFHLLETLIPDRLRRPDGLWELHIAGNLDLVLRALRTYARRRASV